MLAQRMYYALVPLYLKVSAGMVPTSWYLRGVRYLANSLKKLYGIYPFVDGNSAAKSIHGSRPGLSFPNCNVGFDDESVCRVSRTPHLCTQCVSVWLVCVDDEIFVVSSQSCTPHVLTVRPRLCVSPFV